MAEHDYVALSSDGCELVQGGEDEHCCLAHAFISHHIISIKRKEKKKRKKRNREV